MKRELQKIVTRFFYPISIQAWFLGATRELKKVIGIGFSDVIVKFDGKKVEIFRIAEELNTKIKKAMLSYIETEEFLKGTTKYRKLVLKYNMILAKGDSLKRAVDYAAKLYPLLAVSYFVPNLWNEDIPKKKKNKIIDTCKKYRKLSDGFLNRLDSFISNYLKKRKLSCFVTLEILDKKRKLLTQETWLEKRYIFSKGKFYNISWNKFLEENKFFYKEKKITAVVKPIKGKIAFHGVVRGSAKLVFSPFDFKKIKKGDILISPMTQPTFIPILSKVKGIVTDEGGITCHAAIVVREISKPCIIGTKIATQVLKDGDLVEVDANKGVVKILKRAKK